MGNGNIIAMNLEEFNEKAQNRFANISYSSPGISILGSFYT